MSTINKEVAVADAAVAVNIISTEEQRFANRERTIVGVALVGGNAIGEPVVAVNVGMTEVFRIAGSATGLGITRDSILPTFIQVPADKELRAVVITPPTVSPIRIFINMVQ